MQIECAGEILHLCSERAVYWHGGRALLVADTHFGKDGVFRSGGIPIPEGINAHDLQRLSDLILRFDITRLLVLGDFFHGPPALSGDFPERFDTWLLRHPRLKIDVIAGNHDRHGGTETRLDRVCWHQSRLIEPPFLFAHDPSESGDSFLICGHTHPVVVLRSESGDRARVPVFWISARRAVLPAFGSFTGGARIHPQPGDAVYAIADRQVFALNTQRR